MRKSDFIFSVFWFNNFKWTVAFLKQKKNNFFPLLFKMIQSFFILFILLATKSCKLSVLVLGVLLCFLVTTEINLPLMFLLALKSLLKITRNKLGGKMNS